VGVRINLVVALEGGGGSRRLGWRGHAGEQHPKWGWGAARVVILLVRPEGRESGQVGMRDGNSAQG